MKYKYSLCMIRLFEYVALEKYIEDMIRKGWMIDKINNVYIRFRACTPKELHVKIGLNLKTYTIDPEYDTKDATLYRDFIQTFGYEFQCGFGALQVFTSEKNDVIMSDTTIDEHVLRKAIFKDELGKSVFQFFLFLGLLFSQFYNVQMYSLTSNVFLFSSVIVLIFGIFTILRLIPYIRYICTRKIISNPKRLEKKFSYVYIIGMLMLLLGFISIATSSIYSIAFLFVIIGASLIFYKKKAQMHPYVKILVMVSIVYAGLMFAITFMMRNPSTDLTSDNSIVGLTAKDMNGSIGAEPYTQLDESMLMLHEEYDDEDFSYSYYEVKSTILKEYCMQKIWKKKEYRM